jgi:hypothetical protein
VTSATILALLHEGGWDEVLMVGVGLVLAYAIIMLTGRKGRGDEAEATDDDAVEADEPSDRRS